MSTELAQLQAELQAYKDLAARLTDRLDAAQHENEAAYRQAYESAAGPHFCTGQPFGAVTAQPRPGIRDLAKETP